MKIFKDEQEFKMSWITNKKRELKMLYPNRTFSIFCIETNSTVKGFPDVLLDVDTMQTMYYEFKCSDKEGFIKFEKTQPPFYKRNSRMNITVIAFNKKDGYSYSFPAKELFNKDSVYKIDLTTRKVKLPCQNTSL